jgi:iduronate 2-sulfatase
LLISVPGIPQGHGHATNEIVEFLDIYPTLTELVGLTKPEHLEGRSIVKILENPDGLSGGEAFSEMQRGVRLGRTLRNDRYRYVEWTDEAGKLVIRELYDYETDPAESKNIAREPGSAPLMKSMSQRVNTVVPLKSTVEQE